MARWRTTAARGEVAREPLELSEVPAAVVCASCGDALCAGCALRDETTQASGLVAVVPWERDRLPLHERFWSTARLATLSCEVFFGSLRPGPVAPALRFAVLSEVAAVLGLAATLGAVVVCSAPALATAIWEDPRSRMMAVRVCAYAITGVTLAMIGIHLAHGIGLDVGARRAGSRQRDGAGARFGLYACAWDLLTLPLGIALVLLTEGPRSAWRAAALSLAAPQRAASAYLRKVHRLDEASTIVASRFAVRVAALVMFVGLAAAVAGWLLASMT
jgi:hypothetical protein